MTDYQKAMVTKNKLMIKKAKLIEEIEKLSAYMNYLETEYDTITDQYMEGIISAPVGKYQSKLYNERERVRKKLRKRVAEFKKFKRTWGI